MRANDMVIDVCNIQGLRSNFAQVKAHIERSKPAIFFLTETQIARAGSEFSICSYELLGSFAKKHGVCAYINQTLSYARSHKYEINNKHFNSLILRLPLDGNFIFLIALYRSPNTPPNIDCFEQLGDMICNMLRDHPGAQLLIVGDFNAHNVSWLRHSSHTDAAGRSAELLASTFSLEQLVNDPTRIAPNGQFANTLDLVLCSVVNFCAVRVLAPVGSSDHCLLSIKTSIPPIIITCPPPRTVYQFEKANWKELKEFYASYPWRLVTSCVNVNDMVGSLTDAIKLGMRLYIPTSTLQKTNQKIFSRQVKNALNRKQAAYKRYNIARITTGRDSAATKLAHDELRSIANECKKLIRHEDFAFLKKKTDRVLSQPGNPRLFYHTVRSLQSNFTKPSTPPFEINGSTVSDPRAKCNHLATIFAENSILNDPLFSPVPIQQSNSIMPPIIYRRNIVRKFLLELNQHKTAGPDGIPPLILKKFAYIFAPVLTRVFVVAHNTGVYPDAWKVVNVQPIPKKGDKADPANYRPISIISTLSKIFEKYINWFVLNHIEESNILCDRQYGFRKSRSTCDALTALSHDWNEALEQKSEVCAISLDVAKAFDSVWHANLICKLKSCGVDLALVTLIESFLHRRKIAVVLDGYMSDLHEISAGVPQGSPLAATLFLIYVNDLLPITSNRLLSYADDTTLHARLPTNGFENADLQNLNLNRKTMADSLSSDLQRIVSWGNQNLMKFNATKTQLCIISRKKAECTEPILMNDTLLEKSESLRLLGVTTRNDLLWNDHLDMVAKGTAQKLGFLARCRRFFTAEQTLQIYKSLIRPRMEYCSPVWGGACKSQLAILDSIQRRAVRIVNNPQVTNTLQSLQHRRDVADLSLFYRYYFGNCADELKSLIPPPKVVNRTSRATTNYHPFVVQEKACRTTHFQNDFFTRTAHKWNKLPGHVFSGPNLSSFKSNVNDLLSVNPLPRLSSHC